MYRAVELLKKHIKYNLLIYFIVILFFLIGISIGGFTAKIVDKHQKEYLFYYLKNFFQLFYNNELSNLNILRHSLINNLQLLSLNWILGAFLITSPLVLLIVGFKGFVIGFTSALLIEEFKFWGILILVFGILPPNVIIIPTFIIAAVISLTFAISFLKSKIQKNKGISFSKRYLAYSCFFALLLVFTLFASLIESYISPFFIRAIVSNIL